MTISAKMGLKLLFGICGLFLILPAVINYFVDPYHMYRLGTHGFSSNQRYQAAGFIKTFPYRNLIFGTSMTENFIASQATEALGWQNPLRISIMGGYPKEMSYVLGKALDAKEVQNVLMDMHWYYVLDTDSDGESQHAFPYYMYDGSFSGELEYLFNKGTFEAVLGLLGLESKEHFYESPLRLNAWMKESLFITFNNESGLQQQVERLKKIKKIYSLDSLYSENFKYPNIDKYLIPLLERHPETQFHLFFPPYSVWGYAARYFPASPEKILMMRKYLVERTKNLNNVKVYGFDNQCEIVCYTKNYKDYGHYHQWVSDYILKGIDKKENILTTENVDLYLKDFVELINSYSVDDILSPKNKLVK